MIRTALLLLPLALAVSGGPGSFRKEFAAAGPFERIGLLEGLPRRMKDWTGKDRRSLAPFLLRVKADPQREALHAVVLAPLVATGTEAGVLAALSELYRREPHRLRAAARAALVACGGEEATRHLASLLRRDRSERARAILALVLGDRGDRAAGETLLKALSDPAPMVRAAAAEALTRIYGACHGYAPAAWREVVKSAPPPEKPPEPVPPPEPAAPGEVVTSPGTPAEVDPATETGKLVPEFYGIPLDRPVVVAVLDFSESVRGPGADRVKAELVKSLSLLPTVRRFTVLAFDERLLSLVSEPAAATPDLKERLSRFLDRLPPGRRTELLLPIRTAIAMAREEAGEEGAQVLLVSDGAPTVAGPPLDDLLDRAEGLSEAGVRVDAAVYGGRTVGLFRYLTRLTGGGYAALPEPR